LQTASINCELQLLRRMLRLAVKWGKLEKVPQKIELLSGEPRRDRVLTSDEEREYFRATQIGDDMENAYRRALEGSERCGGKSRLTGKARSWCDLTALLIDLRAASGRKKRSGHAGMNCEMALGTSHMQDRKRAPQRSTDRASLGLPRNPNECSRLKRRADTRRSPRQRSSTNEPAEPGCSRIGLDSSSV